MADYFDYDENVHPCEGCEDFDPLNQTCKSNGGCGRMEVQIWRG